MRSPLIAFSLFAVAGPTIFAAAPPSPNLDSESFGDPASANAGNLQRVALPRSSFEDALSKPELPVFGNKEAPKSSNQGARVGKPAPGAVSNADAHQDDDGVPIADVQDMFDSPAQDIHAAGPRSPKAPSIPTPTLHPTSSAKTVTSTTRSVQTPRSTTTRSTRTTSTSTSTTTSADTSETEVSQVEHDLADKQVGP